METNITNNLILIGLNGFVYNFMINNYRDFSLEAYES